MMEDEKEEKQMTSRAAKLAINQDSVALNSKQKSAFTFQIVHAQPQPSQT